MTSSLERVFFSYILSNIKYYPVVHSNFFKNPEIQFVYRVIREYMINSTDPQQPTNKQILEMVSLEDKEGRITKEILKSVLQIDLGEYDEKNFIKPKFDTWILANKLKTGAVDIIDETRNLDDVSDYDSAEKISAKIMDIATQMSSTNFIDDDNMGTDFDDPESHVQDSARYKVNSGFETINHMLGGGWDVATLNILMAETANGKCFFPMGKISIRNIQNGDIKSVEIGKMFSKISKGDYNI